LFDSLIGWLKSAQSQFCRQIVHCDFSGPIFASKPVPDCGDPAFAQLLNLENHKAPSSSQILPPLLSDPVLKKCVNLRFGATFALLIRHLACFPDC